MIPRVGRDWFSLELKAGWQAEQHPECITLTATPEGGSFQLSRKKRGVAHQQGRSARVGIARSKAHG